VNRSARSSHAPRAAWIILLLVSAITLAGVQHLGARAIHRRLGNGHSGTHEGASPSSHTATVALRRWPVAHP
jgi:hypothetical protein